MDKEIRFCEWLKKSLIIIFVSVLLTGIPIGIYFLERKSFVSFLGGYVGAVLTLMGVWVQIYKLEQHRKKGEEKNERERKLGVLEYLKFVLKENIEGAKENDCARNMQLNLLYLTSWDSYKEESRVFTKFKSQFIDNNLNLIMEFEKNIGEDVLKIESLLVDTLEDYNYLLKNKKRRKVLFESLKGNEKLKDKDIEIYDMVKSKEGEISSNKIEKEMGKLIEGVGGELLGTQRKEKWEEMWKYHLLDINLNGKGFEIIKKSEKLLEKIKKEINGL